MKRTLRSRKLLVATVGVASVIYACEKNVPPGNLMAPTPKPTETIVTSGNLMAPPPEMDAGAPPVVVDDAGPTKRDASMPIVVPEPMPPHHRPPGNLMPPPVRPKAK